jgi:hypothetical protein
MVNNFLPLVAAPFMGNAVVPDVVSFTLCDVPVEGTAVVAVVVAVDKYS